MWNFNFSCYTSSKNLIKLFGRDFMLKLKKFSWPILCCFLLIIIFIFGYHYMQNREAVQNMIERTVYFDLVYLHHFIDENEQNDWNSPELVEYRLLTLNDTNHEVGTLLEESSYSFEEVESMITNLYFELMPYSIKLIGTEEGEVLFSQLKGYLEEANITFAQSLDLNYDKHIKRVEHLIELLRQDKIK